MLNTKCKHIIQSLLCVFLINIYYKPELSLLIYSGEESLDSIEQLAGEEPGFVFSNTESATENNRCI